LVVVDKKGKLLTEEKYYALRFGVFDDELATCVGLPEFCTGYINDKCTTEHDLTYTTSTWNQYTAIKVTMTGNKVVRKTFTDTECETEETSEEFDVNNCKKSVKWIR
jgi:hypothetical protein